MNDWLDLSDNANTLNSSYIQGVIDVSGNIIMRNSEQTFINMSDASFNRKFHALKNTAIGKEVDNLENALDVSGNVGITGSLVLDEAPTIYGSLNTDQLSIEGNLITTGGTSKVASKNVTYDTHLNVHGSTITANTSELNHMHKHSNTGQLNPIFDAKPVFAQDSVGGWLATTGMSYDGNVVAFNKGDDGYEINPTSGVVNSFQGILIFQKMYLTQTQWDERTKTTNIPNSTSLSNYILTDDTTLDTSKQYWTQLGSNIRVGFGRDICDLNGDGTRFVTCTAVQGGNPFAGFIVYQYSTPGLLGGSWDAITGVPTGSNSGITGNGGSFVGPTDHTYNRATINYSGNRVLVSDRTHDNGSGTYGTAQVFEYSGSGTTWNLIGEFYGDSSYGTSMFAYNTQAINKSPDPTIDGMFIALNHFQNPEALASGAVTSTGSSTVQIYHYSGSGTTWNQVGGNIYGELRAAYAWNSSYTHGACWLYIDISSDGKTVVMSTNRSGYNNIHGLNGDSVAQYAGNNIVYEYRKLTQSEWDNGNRTSYYPTLNEPIIMTDGDTTLDLNKEYWIQMGNNMYGNDSSSGYWTYAKIIKLDYGTYIYSNEAGAGNNNEGRINVWLFKNNDWEKVTEIVGGEDEYLGYYVEPKISGDGRFIAAGSRMSNDNIGFIIDMNNEPIIDYKYKIHNDVSMVNAAESFGEDVSLNAALTVPGNILIVDSSNSEYNYGAYTIHTDETYTNYFAVGKSASNVFNIVNNNNAGVYMDSGSNSFTGTSDERLKKNIEEIEDESNEKVKQLRPVTYQWKHQTHDKSQAGFIAQEVEKVLPELVKENDSVDGSTYKGVSSDDLIPYLVKYVQKLRKKLETLKETKLKKSVSLNEISVSTNGGSITPSPFSSTDELK